MSMTKKENFKKLLSGVHIISETYVTRVSEKNFPISRYLNAVTGCPKLLAHYKNWQNFRKPFNDMNVIHRYEITPVYILKDYSV